MEKDIYNVVAYRIKAAAYVIEGKRQHQKRPAHPLGHRIACYITFKEHSKKMRAL